MRSHFWNYCVFIFCFLVVLAFVSIASAPQVRASDALAQYPAFNDPGSRSSAGAGTGLVPTSETVDGGTIPIGATAQVVVRFRNDGSQPVQTGLIRLYPSSTVSASVSLNQCEEEPLAAGAECAVALSVKGLQAGRWRTEMLMSHSGRTRLVTATLSGTVESSGDASDKLTSDIEAIPSEIDFGSLEASQTLMEPVILRNITSVPIDINNIYVDSSEQAGYGMKTECQRLEAGQACIAVVSWSPKLKGRSSGVLVINHSGPAGLTSVPLQGEYEPENVEEAEVFPLAVPGRGLMVASQTELDFGTGVQTASTITVSLVNAGDAPLKINKIRISGSDNGLSFKSDGCLDGTILEPIEACPLTVTWSPTRVGPLFDDIQVLHDGARGVLVLPIRGDAESAVSQDQKAIVLSDDFVSLSSGSEDGRPSSGSTFKSKDTNPLSVLDGYRISSFSPTRAIINGPGGSRIVFDGEDIVLGGIPWLVTIKHEGIEFMHQDQRVLLLFDRSLSSINRVSSAGGNNSTTSAGSTGTEGDDNI